MLFKIILFTLAAFVVAKPDQPSSNIQNMYLRPQSKGWINTYGAGPEITRDPIKRISYVLSKKKEELDALIESIEVNDDGLRLITSTLFKNQLKAFRKLIQELLKKNQITIEDFKAYLVALCKLLVETLGRVEENPDYLTGPNAQENCIITSHYQKHCDIIQSVLNLVEPGLIVDAYINAIAALNKLTDEKLKNSMN